MISIYFVVYNEELRLQFMLDHYKKRFPNCNFIIYDNYSTDNTIDIIGRNGYKYIPYFTNNKHDEELLTNLKNSCWKDSKTDWVLICDPDELLDINEEDLKKEELLGTTIIRSTGFNMVNLNEDCNLLSINYGSRSPNYDKLLLFNKKYISDINYVHGSHISQPDGIVKYNTNTYNMYHFHFINPQFVYDRYQMTVKRFPEINKQKGWGIHCYRSLDEINDKIKELRSTAVKLF